MNKTLDAQNKMKELVEKKEELNTAAAKIVAQALIGCQQKGVTKVASVESVLSDLLVGFTDEEKIDILIKATAIAIVNL